MEENVLEEYDEEYGEPFIPIPWLPRVKESDDEREYIDKR